MSFGIEVLRQQRETHTQPVRRTSFRGLGIQMLKTIGCSHTPLNTHSICRRLVFCWLCAMALAGCDALESPEDSKAKSDLVGSWYLEYKDSSERPIKSVVTLTEDGQFTSRERIGDETTESRSSGPWFVTAGLLKFQTVEIDGKKLGRNGMLFATCKLEEMTSRDFVCTQVSGGTFTFRRVQSDFALF